MIQWRLLRGAAFSLSLSLISTIPVCAQGLSEMGAVHGMSATMGAGLHSQAGAASGGLNSVYGSLNKQLGGAASGAGGGGSSSSADFPNVAIDPRLTVATAGKESNHLYDLAVQKQKAGKNLEAEQLYIRSASIRQAIWGNKDPAVWNIMEKIGALKTKRGDYAGAEQWYRIVLTAELKHYGPGVYELVPILEKMGQVSLQQKKYSDAENYLQQVYTQRSRKFGVDNADTVATAIDLARAYSESGDLKNAADILNKTIAAKSNDAGSPQMVKVLQTYATVLKKQNKPEELASIEAKLSTMRPAAPAVTTETTKTSTTTSETTEVTGGGDASKVTKSETKVTETKTSETRTADAKIESKNPVPAKEPVKLDEFEK